MATPRFRRRRVDGGGLPAGLRGLRPHPAPDDLVTGRGSPLPIGRARRCHGDGAADGLVATGQAGTLAEQLNVAGALAFTRELDVGEPTKVVRAADFNGDGIADAAVLSDTAVTVYAGHKPDQSGGDATGGLNATDKLTIQTGPRQFLAVGDFNGDGSWDIAVDHADNSGANFIAGATIYAGDGTGGFAQGQDRVAAVGNCAQADQCQGRVTALAAANLDRSGADELLLGSTLDTQGTPSGYLVIAGESSVCSIASTQFSGDYTAVSAGKLDGDTSLDLAAVRSDGKVALFEGTTSDPCTDSNAYPGFDGNAGGTLVTPPAGATAVAIRDLDGDGNGDLAVAASTAGQVALFTGKGDGTFMAGFGISRIDANVGPGPSDLAFGPIDGDSRPDLLVPNSTAGEARTTYLLNRSVPGATQQAAQNPIQKENALIGDADWQLPTAPDGTLAQQQAGLVTSIAGYTSQASVAAGENMQLHVSTATDGLRYRVVVLRLGWYRGAGARRVACMPGCSSDRAGVAQPAPPAPDPTTGEVAANWSVTDTLPVGSGWISGYYVAQLVITSGPNAGRARVVPFVVRAPTGSRSAVLVQAPVNTWQAYNNWGGKSLYDWSSTSGWAADHVSFDRPLSSGGFDIFDHEIQLVHFLERDGYDVSYATDVDVHRQPGQLLAHRLVMTDGHGEYWSSETRDAHDAARAAGVNLAYMGANTAYWRIRYADGERTIIGYKDHPDPAPAADRTIQFRSLGRPECELLGVQYEEQDSATDGTVRSYAVVAASAGDPWFAGTGLGAGDTVAGTVGYEWDTIKPGCAVPTLTPLFHWSGAGHGGDSNADAVRYTAPSGAQVFASGSMLFALGLDGPTTDPGLVTFMENAMKDLAGASPTPPPSGNLIVNPSFESGVGGWDGYQSTIAPVAQSAPPDGDMVAKVTATDGPSFTIDDTARAVPRTTAGKAYTATAWVRAASASSVGKSAQLKLRELDAQGHTVADVASPAVSLTSTWQQVLVQITTTTTGGSLDVRVSEGDAQAGDAFFADAFSLTPQP